MGISNVQVSDQKLARIMKIDRFMCNLGWFLRENS